MFECLHIVKSIAHFSILEKKFLVKDDIQVNGYKLDSQFIAMLLAQAKRVDALTRNA